MNALFCRKETPWGTLYLRAHEGKLCGVSVNWCPTSGDLEVSATDNFALLAAERWLDNYIVGNNADLGINVPELDLALGTPFQRLVWEETQKIPWGQLITYGTLAQCVAQRSGKRPCARAVGQALHVNPWMIIVPCHRVVQAGRRLGGYAGGPVLKAELLFHEGIEQL